MNRSITREEMTWPLAKALEREHQERRLEKGLSLAEAYEDTCFLPLEGFLDQMRKEKRRVERSRAPLSIAIFYCQGSPEQDGDHVKTFLNSLKKRTRETDIKGWLQPGVIGLILPDTNESGLKRCIELITEGNGHCLQRVIQRTYPDLLIEELLDQSKARPNLFPFDLDYSTGPQMFRHFLKRSLDIVGSLFGLIVFSPLMLLAALAVKISSPGPVIFKQERLGRQGQRFDFYKFRSMYHNNNDGVHREYVTNLIMGNHEAINQGDQGQPVYKMINDNRVTAVGKIIRSLSIDELPQLVNVLKGEMSLVGPRPPIPYEVEKYLPWHLRRILEINPGITGLWQVEGRSRTSFDDMVRLDLRYVKDWTFWLDIKILLKTIKTVIQKAGAA